LNSREMFSRSIALSFLAGWTITIGPKTLTSFKAQLNYSPQMIKYY